MDGITLLQNRTSRHCLMHSMARGQISTKISHFWTEKMEKTQFAQICAKKATHPQKLEALRNHFPQKTQIWFLMYFRKVLLKLAISKNLGVFKGSSLWYLMTLSKMSWKCSNCRNERYLPSMKRSMSKNWPPLRFRLVSHAYREGWTALRLAATMHDSRYINFGP